MLATDAAVRPGVAAVLFGDTPDDSVRGIDRQPAGSLKQRPIRLQPARRAPIWQPAVAHDDIGIGAGRRSEEHTSELQSLMRRSYAVFCLKKKKKRNNAQTP